MNKAKASAAVTEELLTMKEAAAALRCSRETVYQLSRKGRLRLVKFGRNTRITATSLHQFISDVATSSAIDEKQQGRRATPDANEETKR